MVCVGEHTGRALFILKDLGVMTRDHRHGEAIEDDRAYMVGVHKTGGATLALPITYARLSLYRFMSDRKVTPRLPLAS
jgi:hypothetical protein